LKGEEFGFKSSPFFLAFREIFLEGEEVKSLKTFFDFYFKFLIFIFHFLKINSKKVFKLFTSSPSGKIAPKVKKKGEELVKSLEKR